MKIVVSSKLKAKITLISTLVIIFAVLATGFYLLVIKDNAVDASANKYLDYTVVIDAGHGGIDGGTQAKDGTLEKDINLNIALKLKDILESFGVKTVMTRETDISIHNRIGRAHF